MAKRYEFLDVNEESMGGDGCCVEVTCGEAASQRISVYDLVTYAAIPSSREAIYG